MISKLLSLISTAKGAVAVATLATAAVAGGTVATNEDARVAVTDTVQNVTQVVTGASTSPKPTKAADANESGKPAVVAARNDADKKLRDAFQDDQQALEKLHSTKVEGADRQKLTQLVNDADKSLRARLTKALDDVAALTLGREGRESAAPSSTPLTTSPAPTTAAKASPDVKASFAPATQAQVDAIVVVAIADMKKIVTDATTAVAALPTFTPGKPSDQPGGKPSDQPGGRPSDQPGGRPSDTPDSRPSNVPPTARPTPTR